MGLQAACENADGSSVEDLPGSEFHRVGAATLKALSIAEVPNPGWGGGGGKAVRGLRDGDSGRGSRV